MYNKNTEHKNWRTTRDNLAQQFNALLAQKHLSIINIADHTGVPLYVVENISLGRQCNNINDLRPLARFLNKKIQISLVD